MKKIISILLAVLTVFGMFAITASAAKAPTITAKADVSAVKVGDTIKVTVSTSKNSKLCVATLSLLYDEAYFKVTNKTATNAFSMAEFGVSTGKVKFTAISNSNIKDTATDLFTVEFKVLKTGGQIELAAEEVYVVDGANEVNVTNKINAVTLKFNESCKHDCHQGGIKGFFWMISNFFNKIFGSNKYCECGVAHY